MKKLDILFTAAIALAACASNNNSSPMKGSSAKGADAKSAGQKAGSTATADKSMATQKGASYETVTCDDSEEGVAWCDDDQTIIFCSGGIFWALDCGAIGGDFCAETSDTVDCFQIQ